MPLENKRGTTIKGLPVSILISTRYVDCLSCRRVFIPKCKLT